MIYNINQLEDLQDGIGDTISAYKKLKALYQKVRDINTFADVLLEKDSDRKLGLTYLKLLEYKEDQSYVFLVGDEVYLYVNIKSNTITVVLKMFDPDFTITLNIK